MQGTSSTSKQISSSEDVFSREKSVTLISFNLSLLPHTVISSQLSTKISMKSQAQVYPTYRMHQAPLPYYDFIPTLACFHQSQNSLFRSYKGFRSPPKIKTCIKFNLTFLKQFSISKPL